MEFLRKQKRFLGAAAIALLLCLAVLLYWRLRPDPKLAQARELGKQLADRGLSAEQRRELGKQFRDQVKGLSADQRSELFKDRRKAFEDRIAGYFKKSRQEQIAQLDEDIDRMNQFRGPRGAGGPMNNAGPGGSAEDRDLRRRQRLDQTTPEQRAQMAEYFKQLNDRRRQRGLAAGARR